MIVTQNILKGVKLVDLLDKQKRQRELAINVLNRTNTIFKYDNAPFDTSLFELMLQTQGQVIVGQNNNGELIPYLDSYAIGKCNEYYIPIESELHNVWNNVNKHVIIGDDVELCKNDTNAVGLLPHINKMTTLLTECEISIYDSLINNRMVNVISAGDDRTYESAKHFVDELVRGKLAIIGDNKVIDSLGIHPVDTSHSNITELIEMYNTLQAMLYSEYGLNCSTNVKREYVNESDTGNNHTFLANMLYERESFCERLNNLFGTSVTVALNEMVAEDIEEPEQSDETAEPEQTEQSEEGGKDE